jgi:hypothetical protein
MQKTQRSPTVADNSAGHARMRTAESRRLSNTLEWASRSSSLSYLFLIRPGVRRPKMNSCASATMDDSAGIYDDLQRIFSVRERHHDGLIWRSLISLTDTAQVPAKLNTNGCTKATGYAGGETPHLGARPVRVEDRRDAFSPKARKMSLADKVNFSSKRVFSVTPPA